MSDILLTAYPGSILGPIAKLLGMLMDWIYSGISNITGGRVESVVLSIVIITIIIYMCLLPLTIKQQKFSKLSQKMQPEMQAIQAKYKNKKDQASMMAMQEETQLLYQKYGISPMGSCVQMLIQMPILLALYQVFRFIPLYITQLKNLFTAFLTDNGGIMSASGYTDTMKQFGENIDWTNVNTAITEINKFSTENWDALRNAFPAFSDIIANSHASLEQMNTFLGINMSQEPGFGLTLAFLIPVLSGLSQFISVKVAQGNTPVDDDNPMAASMRMTTYIFPLMSAFIAISVPAGLGLYWIATSVIQTIITVFINRYYDKLGAETIVKKNVEKRNKKRAKKGLPPETIAKNATVSTKNVNREKAVKSLEQIKAENEKKVKEIKESAQYYKTAKPGSLAEKAGMVAKYNEKSSKNGARKN